MYMYVADNYNVYKLSEQVAYSKFNIMWFWLTVNLFRNCCKIIACNPMGILKINKSEMVKYIEKMYV